MQASLGVSLKLTGDKTLADYLRRIGSDEEKVELTSAWGAYGVSSTKQRFIDQKGPDGQPWKPSLRAEEGNGMTLRDTSRLFNSFNWHASTTGAEWGTNVIYAPPHQFGAEIRPKSKKALAFTLANGQFVLAKKVTIPARPYVGINAYDRSRFYGIAQDWFKGMSA